MWLPPMRSFITLVVLLFTSSISHAQEDRADEYVLTFGDLEDRQVQVTANLWLDGDELQTDGEGIWFIPGLDSWWKNITINDLSASDGKPICVTKFDRTTAHLDRRVNGQVTVHYTVDISYIDKSLPNANTAAGASFDDGLFIVGKPLFVQANPRLPASVRINKPEHLVFSAPWPLEDGVYLAENGFRLTYTNLVLSRHQPVNIRTGNLAYSVVTLGLSDQTTEIINRFARDAAAYYLETFPLGRTATYMQVAISQPNPLYGGGEAYLASSTSSVNEQDMEELVWRAVFAHELFHMWNSHSLNMPQASDMEWFKEGVTEFITDTALMATGEMNSPQLEARRLATFEKFAEAFQEKKTPVSIAGGGANKGPNYNIVYKGGWTAAIWLDRSLIRETGGQWNMVEFMKLILREYGPDRRTLNLSALMGEIAKIDPKIGDAFRTIITSTDWNTIHDLLRDELLGNWGPCPE